MAGGKQVRAILTLSSLVCAIALPLAVITTVVLNLMFDVSFFRAGQERYHVEQTTGMSPDELLRADQGIARFFGSAESLPTALQQSGANPDVFNQREVLHMNDVRAIVQFMMRLDLASFLLVGAAFAVAIGGWTRGGSLALARGFLWSALFTVGLAAVVGLVTYFAFDQLFLTFHELVFHNDYWQLDPRTDHLIQMFPFEFWYDAMLTVALRVVVIIGAIGLCGFFLARAGRRAA